MAQLLPSDTSDTDEVKKMLQRFRGTSLKTSVEAATTEKDAACLQVVCALIVDNRASKMRAQVLAKIAKVSVTDQQLLERMREVRQEYYNQQNGSRKPLEVAAAMEPDVILTLCKEVSKSSPDSVSTVVSNSRSSASAASNAPGKGKSKLAPQPSLKSTGFQAMCDADGFGSSTLRVPADNSLTAAASYSRAMNAADSDGNRIPTAIKNGYCAGRYYLDSSFIDRTLVSGIVKMYVSYQAYKDDCQGGTAAPYGNARTIARC
jgi:hypothetical protein